MTAIDVLNDSVLSFYEEHSAEVEHILTDNGREYCGRELKHHFELSLAVSQSAHHRTEVRSPQTKASANVSIAPSRRSLSPRLSATRCTSRSRSCRATSIATWISTTARLSHPGTHSAADLLGAFASAASLRGCLMWTSHRRRRNCRLVLRQVHVSARKQRRLHAADQSLPADEGARSAGRRRRTAGQNAGRRSAVLDANRSAQT